MDQKQLEERLIDLQRKFSYSDYSLRQQLGALEKSNAELAKRIEQLENARAAGSQST